MVVAIIIFVIAIVSAFGMLLFRSWELRSGRVHVIESVPSLAPDVSFRHIEKHLLYSAKHIIQSIVLFGAKWWFIVTTKTKKWLAEKWPKVHKIFEKKQKDRAVSTPPSFFKKAVIESKTKIKRIKEKVKRDHGPVENEENTREESSTIEK